ncbi:glycosyltransferase [Lutispora sp.]|uniref:glycosyltransferase n=1 Tax=Lutispora sp. TaxID=2828727 RepID=UPI002B20A299|nr:glycosyltransferase [Lutispora sp.]MEA4961867.1 glycosyltransferase [Lutispora sp.]
MKKVLHLISGGDVGGAKTHVLTLVKELQKNLTVKIVCFMEGPFAQEARDMGIDIIVLPQQRRYDLKVIDTLVKLIKDEGFTLIHSHGARANFITRFIKNKLPIPCVTTIHSDFMLDFKGNLYKHIIYTNLNVFALKKFDYFIAVSESFKQMLIGRGFPADKIFTVYNGMDFDEDISYKSREKFLEERGLISLKDKKLIGILARLHPVKGHEIFIKAAADILASNKNIHFLITGESTEMPALDDLIKQLGIEDNVHFIGFGDAPYDILNAIDINVLTSYSESFPYALLEGARLEKPTISSAVGGIPMLIEDGENGYLFKAGDSNELSRKLSLMIEDEARSKAMGKALYKKADKNYSLKNLALNHINIYDIMLENKKERNTDENNR